MLSNLYTLFHSKSHCTLVICYKIFFSFNRNFQSFDTSQSVDPSTAYSGSFYDPNAYAAPDPVYDAASTDFDNEPPLLEGKTIQ